MRSIMEGKQTMGERIQTQIERDRAIRDLQRQLATGNTGPDRLLQRAVIASGSGITIADASRPDMPLIYVNPAFERITGYTAAECIGHNCRFLHRGEPDQPGLEDVRRAVRDECEGVAVLRNYRKDGMPFWNELYIAPIHDGEGCLTHFIGIQNDVTARVELEEAREFFLQVASHDLKSPLHAILLTARAFDTIAPVGTTISENLHGMLANIASRAREMQGIIDDYLDLQTLDSGRMKIERTPVDLNQLMDRVLTGNSEYAARKRIIFHQECSSELLPVMGDERKITQVAQNLVNNAIKFSQPDSRVTVRIGEEGQSMRVEVSDEGPGLSPEDLRKIFGKFTRLSNSPTGGEKSSGLGLHISKRLMETQGGDIGVFNNPERGATFWFSLPRQ